MRVLVACEFSGVVRDAFADKGHRATSCDILDSELPGDHYKGDVLDILNDGWDMMIAHPPCRYISFAGIRHFKNKDRQKQQVKALKFVKKLMDANIKKIAIENPVSLINTKIRKPDQIIQPWQFGHYVRKRTCLWLKNLPKLQPTEITHIRGEFVLTAKGDRSKTRSKTFFGIAQAMASQWK